MVPQCLSEKGVPILPRKVGSDQPFPVNSRFSPFRIRFRPEANDLCNPIPEGIRQSGYTGMNATLIVEDYPPC